jgi:hypothetical protein
MLGAAKRDVGSGDAEPPVSSPVAAVARSVRDGSLRVSATSDVGSNGLRSSPEVGSRERARTEVGVPKTTVCRAEAVVNTSREFPGLAQQFVIPKSALGRKLEEWPPMERRSSNYARELLRLWVGTKGHRNCTRSSTRLRGQPL